MKKLSAVVFVLVVLAAGIYGYRLWQAGRSVAQPAAPAAPAAATPAPVEPVRPITPEPAPAPAIVHPVEAIPVPVAPAPRQALPQLPDSDSLLARALAQVLRPDWMAWLNGEGIVRRIVVTVDNLPRPRFAAKLSPLQPVPGAFGVVTAGKLKAVAPENATRYLPYVVALENVDLKALVAIYRQNYPLFQQAYRELGYPDAYFNDRLVAVIDHLLATPVVADPIRVVQPKVLYQYADPGLEGLSAGQKLMLRMGADNAARVKQRLQVLRGLLTGSR